MATLVEIIVCSVLIAIILLLIVPSLSYYLRIYYTHRTNAFIQKRHCKIMIIFNILLMISLIGDKSLYMLSIIITDNLQEAHNHIVYAISHGVYFFAGPSIVLAMDVSVWLYFYDMTWATITNPGNKWTYFIDPQFNHNQTDLFANNWFIKNQSKYGNIRWLTKRIAIPIIICVYISLFGTQVIDSSVHYFIFTGWMVVMALFISIVYWYVPKNQIEVLKIKLQWDRLIKLAISFVIFFAAYIILRLFIVAPQYQFALIMPFQYIFALHYYVGGMLSTRYVLLETDLLETKKHGKCLNVFVGNVLSLSPIRILEEDMTDLNDNGSEIVSLARILRNKLSFNAFMSHLLKEFSSENLLAIFECWQYKAMVKETGNRQKDDDGTEQDKDGDNVLLLNPGLIDYQLPSNDVIPRSVIVYNTEDTMEKKALKLIEKYVHSINGNCLFEVNISSNCKYKLLQKIVQLQQTDDNELTLQQLYDIFDEMILELIRLLNDSHGRFLHTDDYKQLVLHDAV